MREREPITNISQWRDKGPHGFHLEQENAAWQPIVVHRISSKPAFDIEKVLLWVAVVFLMICLLSDAAWSEEIQASESYEIEITATVLNAVECDFMAGTCIGMDGVTEEYTVPEYTMPDYLNLGEPQTLVDLP